MSTVYRYMFVKYLVFVRKLLVPGQASNLKHDCRLCKMLYTQY